MSYNITVVNVRAQLPGTFEYCGRKNVSWRFPESPLANPYKLSNEEAPGVTIARYQNWLDLEIQTNSAVVNELKRLVAVFEAKGELKLGCWCAPGPCHCDVIKLKLEKHLDRKSAKQGE